MKPRSKQRRKKEPEALDWRELAKGPALRGLAEVLTTPAAVARERAAKRQAVSVSESPTVGETPTHYDTPTVGGSPAHPESSGETTGVSTEAPAPFPSEPPDLLSMPTGGHKPTEGLTPTVGITTGRHCDGAELESQAIDSPTVHSDPPTVGKIAAPTTTGTEGLSPTEGHTPTDHVSPSVGVMHATAQAIPRPETLDPLPIVRTDSPPTVGLTPTLQTASIWVDESGNTYEPRRVQRVTLAQHSMTLGEERVYQALWHAKDRDGVFSESKRARRFSLGYDRLARLVRLNEKSVRLLLPKMIVKQILEVIAPENSATRTGRTYRIFSYEEILDRQRAADLLYIAKNGRAVVFVRQSAELSAGVSPTEGKLAPRARTTSAIAESSSLAVPTKKQPPTVGVLPSVGESPSVLEPTTGTPGATPSEPVGATTTPLDNVVISSSQTTPSSSSIWSVLNNYGSPDDDAVRTITEQCRKNAPDATESEIMHFIHEKGRVVHAGKIVNPMAFLIVYVPKCFVGDGLQAYREEERLRKQAAEAEAQRAKEEHKRLCAEQEAILRDPNASEADKRFALKILGLDEDDG